MDAWIKIFVVMIMFSMLSMVMTYFLVDPLIGLILLGVILTLLVITLEPATGKAMAQVTVPLVVILFVMEIFLTSLQTVVVFDYWMLLVIGFVLYMMFTMFTGGSSFVEGGFIDAKVSLKLFPFYGIAIFLSILIDPTRQLTVYIMAGTVMGMMGLYFVFLRDYDEWPAYSQFKYSDIHAISDINPKGKVKTGAEIWWAKTTGPPIKSGEKVVIIGITGMTMIVARPEDVIGQDH
ncbi:MAG: NfeD family protein [Candidatus Thorarchaeota archaeon]